MSRYVIARANSLILFALAALLGLCAAMTWQQSSATQRSRRLVEETGKVIATIQMLDIVVRDAETGQRGYLLTGDPVYLDPYESAHKQLTSVEAELQQLVTGNPDQQKRLSEFVQLAQQKFEELGETIQLRRDVGIEPAMRLVQSGVGRNLMSLMKALLGDMERAEQELLAAREAQADSTASRMRLLILGGVGIAALLVLWAVRTLNRSWVESHAAELSERALALRLRTSLDSLSQGVGVFDRNRNLTNWNECFRALLDLPKAMLRVGTPYAAFAEHSETSSGGPLLETENEIRHGRLARGADEPVIYERRQANGHTLEIRRTPLPDDGFVLTVSDMTKRAQADAVLRESQKMQAIGQLTGGIAHDFNNLLTVIVGNLEYVTTKLGDNPVVAQRLERAAWAAQRGALLTSQLLAFARKQPLAPTPINLAATVPHLVPLLRRTLGEHIDVRFIDTAGLWFAMADSAQLEAAVLNLALNARDAMPGGGRLTIELANKVLDQDYARAHAEVTSGDYVMLAVSDTGHGMTPDILARAFEPFFTTKPDGRGTGLGLAMVFGFVKQSGGHISIYSEPGEGTSVKIYLPRATVQAGSVVVPGLQHPSDPLALPRGTATLLVVEDEAAVREIAVEMLRDVGYRVFEAADGEEGLRIFGLNAGVVDLVLTDIVLPGRIRGREMAERIQSIRPSIKVLYMSGYTENSIMHHGRLDDGVELLSKPFKREQLIGKVAATLAKRIATSPTADAEAGAKVVELRARKRE